MPSLSRPLLLFSSLFTLCPTIMPVPARGEITLDGTLGPSGALSGPDYAITADLGRQVGGNLFHSFGSFSVVFGESATFSGPPTVENILARVTGGSESLIDGLLRSTIPGADLYLLNPAGVIFGSHASLDLQGSFHVSTADYLSLGGSGRFDVQAPAASVLTADPPAAFGFLNDAPAGITLTGSQLTALSGETISVVGGDLTVGAGGTLKAPSGRINLISLAAAGELSTETMDTDAFTRLGDISMTAGSRIDTSALFGYSGDIHIHGNNCTVDNSTLNVSSSFDRSGVVDLELQGSLTVTNGAQIQASDPGNATAITIKASTVDISGQSEIDSSAGFFGNGGRISLDVDRFRIRDGGVLTSSPFLEGNGGDITIRGNDCEVDNATINASASFGKSGMVDLELAGGLAVTHGGQIQASDGSESNAIRIKAATVEVNGYADSATGPRRSAIHSSGNPSGNAGKIVLDVGRLQLSDGGVLKSSSLFDGGDITINASSMELNGNSGVSSSSWFGEAGDIDLTLDRLHISGAGSSIAAQTEGVGSQGGDITVHANDSIRISDHGFLGGGTDSEGSAGDILIETPHLQLDAGGAIMAPSFGCGGAGGISINASSVELAGQSFITTLTAGAGNGGDIALNVDRLTLDSGSEISSSSQLPLFQGELPSGGDSGDVSLLARESVRVSGWSLISAYTFTEGDGGNITINTPELLMNDTGFVTTATAGAGQGGVITVDADTITLNTGSQINASTAGIGNAGDIRLHVKKSVTISGNNWFEDGTPLPSAINTNTKAGGHGGDIFMTAESLDMSDAGKITAAAKPEFGDGGNGGSVDLKVTRLHMATGAQITAESSGKGQAGNVRVQVADSIEMDHSSITTATTKSDGGNAIVNAGRMIHLDHSAITTSVKGEDGNGGNITIDPEYLILDHSRIEANAWGGAGGNIHISAGTFIKDPASTVSASSVLGIDGVITVDSPTNDVAGALVVLPTTFPTEVELAGDRCTARTEENSSSLVVEGSHDPLPGEGPLLAWGTPPRTTPDRKKMTK